MAHESDFSQSLDSPRQGLKGLDLTSLLMFHFLHELDSTQTKCISLMKTLPSMHYCKKAQVVSASVNFEFNREDRFSRFQEEQKQTTQLITYEHDGIQTLLCL